jgi:hypothetical protein
VSTRNLLGAGALFIAWLMTAAAVLVHPAGAAHKGIDLLTMAIDHRTQLLMFAGLYLVSALLFIPAMVLISNRARGRGAIFLPIASMLVLVGAVGHAAESTLNVLLTVIASVPADAAAKARVIDDSTGLIAPVLVLAVVFDLALIVLAGAAWRARLTSFWPLVLVTLGAMGGNLAPPNAVFQVVTLVPVTVGIGWIALGVARGAGSSTVAASNRSASPASSPASIA